MSDITVDLTDNPSSKSFNPQSNIHYVPYEREIVKFVDRAVEMARGNTSKKVETESDWKVLEFLYRGFAVLYPDECRDFEGYMQEVHRATQINKAISNGEHGAKIHHVMNIPEKFYKMIQVIYPNQEWSGINGKKFVLKFQKRFKILAGHV